MTALRNAYLPQWAATLGVAGVSTVLTFLLGRFLGPEGFGIYSYALALASLWAIIQDGGFACLLQRENAAPSPNLSCPTSGLPALAMGQLVAATAAGIALALLLPVPDGRTVAAAVLCLGFSTGIGFATALLRGRGEFAREAAWSVVVRLATALALAATLLAGLRRPDGLLLVWAAAGALCLFFPAARELRVLPRLSRPRSVLLPCLAFTVVSAATQIYFRSDTALLRLLGQPAEAVGRYAAAYRLVEGMALLLAPLGHIWFRDLRLVCRDAPAFRAALARRTALLAAAAAGVVAVFLAVGPLVVRLTFGPGFEDPGLVRWLSASLLFMAPNTVLTQAGVALGAERAYAVAASAAALLNVGLNLALIPAFGGLGAAWATLAAEAVLFACLCRGIARRLRETTAECRP